MRPVRMRSMALDKPISFGSLTVPPSIRGTPNLVQGTQINTKNIYDIEHCGPKFNMSRKLHLLFRKPILLFSSTTLRSHIIANSSPPATQYLNIKTFMSKLIRPQHICINSSNSCIWSTNPFTAAITGLVRYILVGPYQNKTSDIEPKHWEDCAYHWPLVHQNLSHFVCKVTRVVQLAKFLYWTISYHHHICVTYQ